MQCAILICLWFWLCWRCILLLGCAPDRITYQNQTYDGSSCYSDTHSDTATDSGTPGSAFDIISLVAFFNNSQSRVSFSLVSRKCFVFGLEILECRQSFFGRL